MHWVNEADPNDPGIWALMESVLGRIDDPWLLLTAVVLIFALFLGPSYIRAISEARREGRRVNAELTRRQRLLDMQIAKRLKELQDSDQGER